MRVPWKRFGSSKDLNRKFEASRVVELAMSSAVVFRSLIESFLNSPRDAVQQINIVTTSNQYRQYK
jgi:hypothetical protein